MEHLIPFTLFGSGTAFGVMLVLLFLILMATDLTEEGEWYALLCLLAAGICNHLWGTFPIMSVITVLNVVLYLTIGFIFSLVRTYFKGRKLSKYERDNFKLREHVFRWWLMFPISMITWVCGDVLMDAYDWAYAKLNKLYEFLLNVSDTTE